MFFGLTNSPATFQIMMNRILRDLINTGEVASFIDNIIVEMEEEEGYCHKLHSAYISTTSGPIFTN